MLGHHPLDVLVVVVLENAPQLTSMAKSDLRFLPHPVVSYPAYNLGDRRQATFCNLDNLRAEGSPNGFRDVIARKDESLESVLYFAEIGFGLSQSNKGACDLPSPIPDESGHASRGGRHDKYQQQWVDLNTPSRSAEEPVNPPKKPPSLVSRGTLWVAFASDHHVAPTI